MFQHAEELPPGGARELIAAGALDGVDVVVGAHRLSHSSSRDVAAPGARSWPRRTRSRSSFAAPAATPRCRTRPSTRRGRAAQVVVNLQQIVSREVEPADPAVGRR